MRKRWPLHLLDVTILAMVAAAGMAFGQAYLRPVTDGSGAASDPARLLQFASRRAGSGTDAPALGRQPLREASLEAVRAPGDLGTLLHRDAGDWSVMPGVPSVDAPQAQPRPESWSDPERIVVAVSRGGDFRYLW